MSAAREKSVRVSVLKARLSEFLRVVRRGHAVTVLDRDTPVARLVPYDIGKVELSVRLPTRSLRDVELLPPLGRPTDSLAALEEERQSAR